MQCDLAADVQGAYAEGKGYEEGYEGPMDKVLDTHD